MVFSNDDSDNVITFTFAKHGENNEALFLDGVTVPDDLDLKMSQRKMSNEAFAYYEKIAMKIYTLLASLTKRIMNEENIPKIIIDVNEGFEKEKLTKLMPAGFDKVIDKFSTVTFFLARGNKQTAQSFLKTSICSCVPPQKIAKSFHSNINKRMLKYFNL